MIWYHVGVCVTVLCFLHVIPSESRPSTEATLPCEPAQPTTELTQPAEHTQPTIESKPCVESTKPTAEPSPCAEPTQPAIESIPCAESTKATAEPSPCAEPTQTIEPTPHTTEPIQPNTIPTSSGEQTPSTPNVEEPDDDSTTILVKAQILLHVYENGTVSESDVIQTTAIVIDGETEDAITGGNSTFTIIDVDETVDDNSNDTVTTLRLTTTIEAVIPDSDNITASADTSISYKSEDTTHTSSVNSDAAIKDGVIFMEDVGNSKKAEESSPNKVMFLNNGTAIELHLNVQLDSSNETTTLSTDSVQTATISINDDGKVIVSTKSKSNTEVVDDDDTGGSKNGKDDSLGDQAAQNNGSADDKPTGAIITTRNEAVTTIDSNNYADVETTDKVDPPEVC